VVDHVIEIPLPSRTLSGFRGDDCATALRAAVSSFVAGPENRLAAVAVNRLLQTNDLPAAPQVLAIHGNGGTGKTHLASGLVRSWQDRAGDDCAEYFTAADFRHLLADAIKTGSVNEFRGRIRGRKLLSIDDIDRLPRDDYLQQELRFTLDACARSCATVVVTSSSPIYTLRNLTADVRSRLAAGLELRLAPPGEVARKQLALQVSAALGQPLSEVAAGRLAAAAGDTAGDVFAALFEFSAHRSLRSSGNELGDMERYLAHRAARRPTMRAILQTVAKHYHVPQKVLKSSSRRQSAVAARAMAVYLARELASLSYDRIGAALGGRDHSTIMHNYRKVAETLTHDHTIREIFGSLQRNLQRTA